MANIKVTNIIAVSGYGQPTMFDIRSFITAAQNAPHDATVSMQSYSTHNGGTSFTLSVSLESPNDRD